MGHPRPRPKRLAEKLLTIRETLGVSQSVMVNRLGVDLAPNNISKYEHNLNEPPTDVMLAYARLARVPLEQLVDDEMEVAAQRLEFMSQVSSRHPLNAPGTYYVDSDTCLNHQCCIDAAPNNFKMDEHLTAYVFKQPATSEEEAQCRQALADCPMAAIHDDGES